MHSLIGVVVLWWAARWVVCGVGGGAVGVVWVLVWVGGVGVEWVGGVGWVVCGWGGG